MQGYENFHDIPHPLQVKKTARLEKRAELFSAFSFGDTLFFEVSLHSAFAASALFLRVYADDDGHVSELPLQRTGESQDGTYHLFSITLPLSQLCRGEEDGLFYYRIVADTAYGRLYSRGEDISENAHFAEDEGYENAYQLTVYREGFRTPDFLKTGVMYQIFVDRFFRGGDAPPRADVEMAASWSAEISQYPAYPGAPLANNLFYGGDLDGVRKKLPYLRSLGVSVLYLCPIFEAYSNHKYDTGDYMRVDEMFGGRAALDRLIAAAKEEGVRVILDGVFNHPGAISRYFNIDGRYGTGGAYQDRTSPYYPWYTFYSYPNEYHSWWGINILPTVNSANLNYIHFITGKNGVADTYLSAGIDGFRLDVADELSPEFLMAFRERVKEDSPENAVIGEVWEDASNKEAYGRRRRYFRGGELDSVMNYPLRDAIIRYLLYGDSEGFSRVTRTLYAHYPRCVSEALMNLLGTHDTVRILTVLGGCDACALSYEEMKGHRLTPSARELAARRLRLAYAILAFMPGIPCIYYGDEVGMEGGKDPFNRRTFPWGGEDARILAFFREISRLRAASSDLLAHGYYRVLHAQGANLVLSREGEGEALLLLLNAGEFPFSYSLPQGGAVEVAPMDFLWKRISK